MLGSLELLVGLIRRAGAHYTLGSLELHVGYIRGAGAHYTLGSLDRLGLLYVGFIRRAGSTTRWIMRLAGSTTPRVH